MDIGVRFTLKVTAKIAGQRGLFNDIFKQPVNIDLSDAFSRSVIQMRSSLILAQLYTAEPQLRSRCGLRTVAPGSATAVSGQKQPIIIYIGSGKGGVIQ